MCGMNFQVIWTVSLRKIRQNKALCANIARTGSLLDTSYILDAGRDISACTFHPYQRASSQIKRCWEQAA